MEKLTYGLLAEAFGFNSFPSGDQLPREAFAWLDKRVPGCVDFGDPSDPLCERQVFWDEIPEDVVPDLVLELKFLAQVRADEEEQKREKRLEALKFEMAIDDFARKIMDAVAAADIKMTSLKIEKSTAGKIAISIEHDSVFVLGHDVVYMNTYKSRPNPMKRLGINDEDYYGFMDHVFSNDHRFSETYRN